MSISASASVSNKSQTNKLLKNAIVPEMEHERNSFPDRRASVFHSKRHGTNSISKRLSKSDTDLSENCNKPHYNNDKKIVSIVKSEVIGFILCYSK